MDSPGDHLAQHGAHVAGRRMGQGVAAAGVRGGGKAREVVGSHGGFTYGYPWVIINCRYIIRFTNGFLENSSFNISMTMTNRNRLIGGTYRV